MPAIHFSNVSFSYSSAAPILTDASFDLGQGWTGLVGPNGAGKSTLLSLIDTSLTPDHGHIQTELGGLRPVLCVQRVDELTPDIQQFASQWDRDAVRQRAQLRLEIDQLERWQTLSPGERKRWQIATALHGRPDILLLDEPTNHLDAEARSSLVTVLAGYRGCGVVVSHDRTLLNELTTRTLRIRGGHVELWNGAYDIAKIEWTRRADEMSTRHENMKAEQKKLARRLDEQRRKSLQKDAERVRERRSADKHDLDTRGSAASYKHERGQKTGAQTVASMTNSLRRVTEDIDAGQIEKDRGGNLTFDFEPATKEFLSSYVGPVTAGENHLFDVDLAVRRTDKIRIAGRNGAGKTTLMQVLLQHATIPADKVLSLEQETSIAEGQQWLESVRALPRDTRGSVMSLVSMLGADPASLLVSEAPSPGEARKLALALALGTPKWLLVLDEPTNHLDLASIERLELALSEFPGALLLVTHDDTLANTTTTDTWQVAEFSS